MNNRRRSGYLSFSIAAFFFILSPVLCFAQKRVVAAHESHTASWKAIDSLIDNGVVDSGGGIDGGNALEGTLIRQGRRALVGFSLGVKPGGVLTAAYLSSPPHE